MIVAQLLLAAGTLYVGTSSGSAQPPQASTPDSGDHVFGEQEIGVQSRRGERSAVTARPTAAALEAGQRLQRAYPDHIAVADGADLVWRDGTRMTLDDGHGEKPPAAWFERPDLKDMFRHPYPAGSEAVAPAREYDPGRARNAAFFDKMYGDCSKREVAAHLVDVAWLPSRSRVKLKVTGINGVAARLERISAELDALPPAFDRFLLPPAGTYNCRAIAGTNRSSAHGYGIAIDIAIRHAHYWRWSTPNNVGQPVWRNEIPMAIIAIFERHGFIWGGRWSHFDTMHFEYRPELMQP